MFRATTGPIEEHFGIIYKGCVGTLTIPKMIYFFERLLSGDSTRRDPHWVVIYGTLL